MSFSIPKPVFPALLILVLVLLVACGTNPTPSNTATGTNPESMADESMSGDSMADESMGMGYHSLNLTLSGLPTLSDGSRYAGWAIIDGAPTRAGQFNVNALGQLVDLTGSAIADGHFPVEVDLSGASAIIITIEASGEAAGEGGNLPATPYYLTGSLTDGAADLKLDPASMLGDEFGSAHGRAELK